MCGVLCGAKSFRGIEAFCRKNEKFYCEWLDLPHGIPSHDTFAPVFQVVDPEEVIGALTEWLLDLRARRGESDRPLVAIDGKRCEGRSVGGLGEPCCRW